MSTSAYPEQCEFYNFAIRILYERLLIPTFFKLFGFCLLMLNEPEPELRGILFSPGLTVTTDTYVYYLQEIYISFPSWKSCNCYLEQSVLVVLFHKYIYRFYIILIFNSLCISKEDTVNTRMLEEKLEIWVIRSSYLIIVPYVFEFWCNWQVFIVFCKNTLGCHLVTLLPKNS